MTRPLTRFASIVAVTAALLACDDSTGPTEIDLGFPTSGTTLRAVTATGADTFSFLAGRSGPAHVAICGNAGVDLNLLVAGATASTTSNCEQVDFVASQGAIYRAIVQAPVSGGTYALCWNVGASCTVTAPAVDASGAPPNYYASVGTLTGSAFLAALNDIIDNQTVLGYTIARDRLYADVDDPDNDDVIIDIYAGRSAPGVNTRATAGTANLNTEHSWPQSKGATEDPAMSDLNILFSADAMANGQRSNHPFGEVKGAVIWTSPAQLGSTERSRLGYASGSSGQIVFEPRASKKGDIARAILYFYTRYSPTADRTASFSLDNYTIEKPILVKWSTDDPPDAFERARNNLVFREQLNRNPFIDRPDWAGIITGLP